MGGAHRGIRCSTTSDRVLANGTTAIRYGPGLSATYSRHVSILWELDIAIPGTLLQRYASLAA